MEKFVGKAPALKKGIQGKTLKVGDWCFFWNNYGKYTAKRPYFGLFAGFDEQGDKITDRADICAFTNIEKFKGELPTILTRRAR